MPDTGPKVLGVEPRGIGAFSTSRLCSEPSARVRFDLQRAANRLSVARLRPPPFPPVVVSPRAKRARASPLRAYTDVGDRRVAVLRVSAG